MQSVIVTCWDVYGWNRGRWTMRERYSCEDEANEQAEALHHRTGQRTKVLRSTRRVLAPSEPVVNEARRFREAQADRMMNRRLATTYYKSGFNGTELAHPPKDGGEGGAENQAHVSPRSQSSQKGTS